MPYLISLFLLLSFPLSAQFIALGTAPKPPPPSGQVALGLGSQIWNLHMGIRIRPCISYRPASPISFGLGASASYIDLLPPDGQVFTYGINYYSRYKPFYYFFPYLYLHLEVEHLRIIESNPAYKKGPAVVLPYFHYQQNSINFGFGIQSRMNKGWGLYMQYLGNLNFKNRPKDYISPFYIDMGGFYQF